MKTTGESRFHTGDVGCSGYSQLPLFAGLGSDSKKGRSRQEGRKTYEPPGDRLFTARHLTGADDKRLKSQVGRIFNVLVEAAPDEWLSVKEIQKRAGDPEIAENSAQANTRGLRREKIGQYLGFPGGLNILSRWRKNEHGLRQNYFEYRYIPA